MKILGRLSFLVIAAFSAIISSAEAAQTERSITFALSGFSQGTNGNAVPFRVTTKDVLLEISETTGQNFINGVLLLIAPLPQSTNVLIVARKVTAGITNQLDVTDFFSIEYGEELTSSRTVKGLVKSKTHYAVDQFQFSTLGDSNGAIALTLQGFSRQMETAFTKTVGANIFSGFGANLGADANGEIFGLDGLIGPVKGKFTIGAPKFVATAAPLN